MGYLNIGLTKRCNLKCKMCDSTGEHNCRNEDMSFEVFKDIVDQVQGKYRKVFRCDVISFAGYGENLLNKDFVNILKYAKKKFRLVKITTNGTLLNEKVLTDIFKMNINEFHISMTGSELNVYSKFQGYGYNKKAQEKILSRVKENIKLAVAIKERENSKTEITMRYVLNKESKKGALRYIKFCKEAGIDRIYFYKDFHEYKGKKIYKKCEEIGKSFSIDYNGKVLPCCEDFMGEVCLGNIVEDDLFVENLKNLKKCNNNLRIKELPYRCQNCRHIKQYSIVERMLNRPYFIYFDKKKINWKKTISIGIRIIKESIKNKEKLQS